MICRVPRFRISGSGWFQRKSCPMQWQSKILGRITFFDIQFITTNLVNRGKKYVKSHVHTLKKRRKIDQLKKNSSNYLDALVTVTSTTFLLKEMSWQS